ncbi:hypothetical protein Hdeb2414_s0011g00363451 [Helianthus debilis subsp. tardiflorus]
MKIIIFKLSFLHKYTVVCMCDRFAATSSDLDASTATATDTSLEVKDLAATVFGGGCYVSGGGCYVSGFGCE